MAASWVKVATSVYLRKTNSSHTYVERSRTDGVSSRLSYRSRIDDSI